MGDETQSRRTEKNLERFRSIQHHVGEETEARCCEKGCGENKSMRDRLPWL